MVARTPHAVSHQWLDFHGLLPTRGLQVAFEFAFRHFGYLTDHTLAHSIIRNNPGIVHPDLVSDVQTLVARLEQLGPALAPSKLWKVPSRQRFCEPIRRVQGVLQEFLEERAQGLHHAEEDYSIDTAAGWVRTAAGSTRDLTIVGVGDYLRLVARAIDHGPSGKLLWAPEGIEDHFDHYTRTLWERAALGKTFDKKWLSKLLKSLARDASFAQPHHQDIVLLLSSNRIHVRPLSFIAEGNYVVNASGHHTGGSAHHLLSDQINLHIHVDHIFELEDLINSRTAREQDFQEFFEAHPEFLLGTDYRHLVAQPVLVRPDEANLVPDFVLIPHGHAAPKIVELKLPSMPISRQRASREGFLQNVIVARDQLLEYRSFFSSRTAAKFARDNWGCEIYLPRIAVVIGRSSSFGSEYERRKAESRVPDVEVMTYDDILERARICRQIGGRSS